MQQDRLIGAAGEGRYEARPRLGRRPEYGNSLLVRAPLGATRRRAPRARAATGRRSGCASTLPGGATLVVRRDPPPPRGRRRGGPRRAGRRRCWPGSTRRPPPTPWSSSATSTPTPTRPPTRGCRAPGSAPRTPRRTAPSPAVTWPSGLQAPAMDTDGDPGCLDYIWLRGAVAVEEARLCVRPAGGRGPDPVPVRPPRDRGHGCEIGRPPGWPTGPRRSRLAAPRRLAARAGELARQALAGARRGIPGCDGVEFDVRLSRDGVPVAAPRRDARARPGPAGAACATSTRPRCEAAASRRWPRSSRRCRSEAFLDVELKGDRATARRRQTRCGPVAARRRIDAVVSSFDEASLAAMAKALPDWPRWLNAVALDADAVALATRLGCRAIAVQWKAVTAASLKRAARPASTSRHGRSRGRRPSSGWAGSG